mmetsp:Transcript_17507/g.40780  ORF Transcript_17507/g.40780 Transcript_17507/m.40780 type:complete len:163 (+) Transcript_17507:107-595(+)
MWQLANTAALALALFVTPTSVAGLLRAGVNDRSSCHVYVTEAGDHSMKLSDGQAWTGLNTGVMITSSYAGEWTPDVHQHNITAADIDSVVGAGVHVISIGRGVVGDGVAKLHSSAKARLAELRQSNVDVFVGNTYEARDYFNAACEKEGSHRVAALFHTGCF